MLIPWVGLLWLPPPVFFRVLARLFAETLRWVLSRGAGLVGTRHFPSNFRAWTFVDGGMAQPRNRLSADGGRQGGPGRADENVRESFPERHWAGASRWLTQSCVVDGRRADWPTRDRKRGSLHGSSHLFWMAKGPVSRGP